ncbi:hypothetical protein N2152v2_006492 [Parachlorella kessleri]
MTEEEMRQHVDPWYEKYMALQIEVPGKDLCDMSGAKGRTPDQFTVFNVMLPRKYNPAQQGNLFERRSKAIAEQLHGPGMGIDYDQMLAKRAASSDAVFAWHQDAAYWPPLRSDLSTATCWLAVTDSNRENGCMRFIPGSQKEPKLRPHAPVGATREESHALFTPIDEVAEGAVYVEITRGDITVHDERVIHGSGPNMSSSWRKGYVLAYRRLECIEEERSYGFSHSHNDTFNWDKFHAHTRDAVASQA